MSCQLLSINNKYSLICFFLSDSSIIIYSYRFDIENNTLILNNKNINFYPKKNAETTKKVIKSFLHSNIILGYFEFYFDNFYSYISDYKCLIYDYNNNKFKEYYKYYLDYYEIFNFNL